MVPPHGLGVYSSSMFVRSLSVRLLSQASGYVGLRVQDGLKQES